MLLNLILFIICAAAFIWFVPRWGFVRRAGLKDNVQRILISFKILLGFAAAAYLGSIPTSDHVLFNVVINDQFQILLNHPADYFNEISYQYQRHGTGKLFAASDSFWGYIRHHLVYMFSAPMNFISGGNFYLNAALFSLFTYFGHLFFFKIYHKIYPERQWLMITACFFIPSLLLFTACVHKDGFVFVSLGIVSYVFFRLLQREKMKWKYIFAVFLALACIFLLRNYVLVALIPAMIGTFVASKWQKNKLIIVAGIYIVFTILFFASGYISDSFNLPEAVITRKQDFAMIEAGNSSLPMNELQPTAMSFLKNSPQAISHSLFRPSPFESIAISSVIAGLEVYFYVLILLAALWYKRKSLSELHNFNIYAALFFFTMLLIIGFTIPNIGAIVRYRSLLWIFMLAPVLNQVVKNWKIGSSRTNS